MTHFRMTLMAHNNVPRNSNLSSINAQNMASIFVRVGICTALFSCAMNHFLIIPYDIPCVACCNKAQFLVHRRHTAGDVCEQRMTALPNYIYIEREPHSVHHKHTESTEGNFTICLHFTIRSITMPCKHCIDGWLASIMKLIINIILIFCIHYIVTKWKHWILSQPDQVSKTETMARGGTKPYLWQPVIASQSSNKGWKSHRQLFRPDWGSSVWRTDGQCQMTGCF